MFALVCTVITGCLFLLTADIPEEQLLTCGVAECGLSVNSNSSNTKPPQTLIFTLVGCYIGKIAVCVTDVI